MQSRKLSIIIAFMLASIIGIIGLQAYWVVTAVQERSREFDARAKRALYATVKDLAKSQAETTIITRFGEIPDVERIWNDARAETQVSVSRDTFVTKSGVEIKSRQIVENSFVSDEDEVIVIETRSRVSAGEEELEIVQHRGLEFIEEALQNVVVQELTEAPDLEVRIGNKNLDSLLGKNLNQEGVELEFSFAVVTDSLVPNYSNTEKVDDTFYSASIFPEFSEHSALYLGFPSKGTFILQSMGSILLFVLVFSFLMVGSFVYAVRFMLRQKRLSAMKTDFINNMTHEFKTPLATIGLAAESMVHPKVKTDQSTLSRYSELIIGESKKLNHHVENILQLAKIERKELLLSKEAVSLNILAAEAINAHRLMIEKRGAALVENFSEKEIKICADPDHFRNSISNLIDNAIKYSPQKPVISVETGQEGDSAVLTVSDQGMGMGSEAKEKAFEAFYREESGNVHTVKGFGVGLSYVKEIAERHDGLVLLKSKLGKGTTVTIKIPLHEG